MLRSATLVVLAVPLALAAACASPKPAAISAPQGGAADAGATDAFDSRATSMGPFEDLQGPSKLPDASVRTTGVRGSPRVEVRAHDAWTRCSEHFRTDGRDLASNVERLGGGCASATAMKKSGPLLEGNQKATSAAQAHKLGVGKGRCVRVYGVAAESARAWSLVVRDAQGFVAAEALAEGGVAVLPREGALCFGDESAATVTVGIGEGEGRYALQIWTD
jgi:hypothetical protein